ncbi:unnamed protein product [Citrullus colocynthis]|uniref:Secreted protein n=1 Tax=Citrullus colocynthis TaxID=252529 RepID=A0ABP0XYB6_9ROSI
MHHFAVSLGSLVLRLAHAPWMSFVLPLRPSISTPATQLCISSQMEESSSNTTCHVLRGHESLEGFTNQEKMHELKESRLYCTSSRLLQDLPDLSGRLSGLPALLPAFPHSLAASRFFWSLPRCQGHG